MKVIIDKILEINKYKRQGCCETCKLQNLCKSRGVVPSMFIDSTYSFNRPDSILCPEWKDNCKRFQHEKNHF